jgi:hypothetical protein
MPLWRGLPEASPAAAQRRLGGEHATTHSVLLCSSHYLWCIEAFFATVARMLAATLSNDAIEEEALRVQREMWDRQVSLWPGKKVQRLDCCDPWEVASYLDIEVQEGDLSSPGVAWGMRLGGFFNRPAQLIAIADQLKPRTARFTLAHEIGHFLIHPGIHHHREMPIHGLGEPRDPVQPEELQANHFAGCLLVPTSLLKRAFWSMFKIESLSLTDDVAYDLMGADYMALMNSAPYSLAFHRRVGEVERFRGKQFQSLVNLFQVHPTTMAVRLRQCGLVRR